MVATVVVDELQVTCVVMSTAPGLPVAVQLEVAPRPTLAGEQLTAIAVKDSLTVNVALAPDVPVAAAVIIVVPEASAVARPDGLIVATVVLEDVQATVLVKSLFVPSL
jgi:hypothetical protein